MAEIFYIRGHAKSGTNWLCNLVNLHPAINCKGEFHLDRLFTGLHSMQKEQWSLLNQAPATLNESFYAMVKSLVIEHCGHQPMNGDRTPCYLHSTFIPAVKTLYISRDGRDSAISWAFHVFNNQMALGADMLAKMALFQTDPSYFDTRKKELLSSEGYVRSFARLWNQQIVADCQMMEIAGKGEIDMPYYWIRYEDLHQDTERYRNEIYHFLGVNPTQAAPLAAKTIAGFNRIDNTSFFRRGEAGIWKEYFTEEQLGWFMEEAGEALNLINKKSF